SPPLDDEEHSRPRDACADRAAAAMDRGSRVGDSAPSLSAPHPEELAEEPSGCRPARAHPGCDPRGSRILLLSLPVLGWPTLAGALRERCGSWLARVRPPDQPPRLPGHAHDRGHPIRAWRRLLARVR